MGVYSRIILLAFTVTQVECSITRTEEPSPLDTLKSFLDGLCGDCHSGCSMLSGEWTFVVPVPPYEVESINATGCLALCEQRITNPSFCSNLFIDSHSHSVGNSAQLSFINQWGTTRNDVQCTVGTNDNMYAEIDGSGKISVLKEFYDPQELFKNLQWCNDSHTEPVWHHPALYPAFWVNPGVPHKPAKEQYHSPSVQVEVDDTNATALCLGMMDLYSHRRCEEMRSWVAPDFRFVFAGGPEEGVDVDFLINNCALPNPPEYINVQEWYVENRTIGYFWDFYSTSTVDPITKSPCAFSAAETYRCTATETEDGLRLLQIQDTFDTAAYSEWAESCHHDNKLRHIPLD